MTIKIQTIACDKCDREWPTVSEQGVHTKRYGHCYHCMLTWVLKRLRKLQDKVDYVINTCNRCAGTEESRVDCTQCDTLGYMVDKKK